jgi:tetratricopeptide (TPR) repeat protein
MKCKPAYSTSALALILFVLSVATAWSQSSPPGRWPDANVTHTVTGSVRKPSGEALTDPVRIDLQAFSGGVVAGTYTDASGRFEFRGIPNGNYLLHLRKEGYQEVNLRMEVFSRRSTTFRQDLFLEPVLPPPGRGNAARSHRDPSGPAVSVARLSQSIPKKAAKEFERALSKAKSGQTEQAIQHLQKAIELFPNYYQARNNLGAQYIKLARYDEALPHLLKAVAIDPTGTLPYINLGDLYSQKKEFHKAIDVLNKAIQLDPTAAVGHYRLGQVYYEIGALDEAEKRFRKACEMEPKQMADARLNLANIYLKQKDYSKVVTELEIYLAENSDSQFAPQARKMLEQLKGTRTAGRQ